MPQKSLVIAEKPSVGREIASILQCKEKHKGYLEGTNHVVTWTQGHLLELIEPHQYSMEYKTWRLDPLPIIPHPFKLRVIRRTATQYKIVSQLMLRSDIQAVVNACDAGREGELIFRNVYVYSRCRKPIQRLWINNMTPEAIREGFRKLRDGREYDRLYDAARCRSYADWLVGINITRLKTLLYDVLLTVGRVQSPTLCLIVERQREINQFVPELYFEIIADFGVYSGQWYRGKETSVSKREEAEHIKQQVDGKTGEIIKVLHEDQREMPPLLYDLTALQRDANSRFGFSAERTLKIAQLLYEQKKAITYPRTDSRYLPEEMRSKLPSLIQQFESIPPFGDWVSALNQMGIHPTKRMIDDRKVSDHHAIIPTHKIPSSLQPDEHRIYDLIVRRFFAGFFPPAEYKKTKVATRVEQELFGTAFRICIQEGWKITQYPSKKEESSERIPSVSLEKGQRYPVEKVEILEKQTQPPKPYTEATLLSAMEHAGKRVDDETLREAMKKRGLGTPATRAEIIERLLHVNYIYRNKKNLHPTEKGMLLISILEEELKSPELTGEWEYKLREIERGKGNAQQFMDEIISFVETQVDTQKKAGPLAHVNFDPEPHRGKRNSKQKHHGTHSKRSDTDKQPKPMGSCPVCHEGTVIRGVTHYYCSQSNERCSFTLPRKLCGKTMTIEMVKNLISQGETGYLEGFISKQKKKFTAKLRLSKEGNIIFDFPT
jgi:DNA topoisomerase III